MKSNLKLDKWQEEILHAKGNLCICSGRQVGKSTVVAIKAAEYAIKNPKKFILLVSVTEDQAERLLSMIMLYLKQHHKGAIKKGKDRPTKSKILLFNGSTIRSKPIGQTGHGVLGYTVDLLIADEAAFMPEQVWNALSPMMLTTGGDIILISTPNTKEGYFYKAFTEREMGFQTFHVNSEEVAEDRAEPQRSVMIKQLKEERIRMTKFEYARWYLAQFQDDIKQLFSDGLISECQQLDRPGPRGWSERKVYLGVDVARMGGDETTFEILMKDDDRLIHIEHITWTKTLTTQTTQKIIELDNQYNFRRIYVDDGGMGVAVFDNLLINDQTRRKVVPINNASRSVDSDPKKPKVRKLLKEDLYMNLLSLMERGQIQLLKDNDIAASLKSVVCEPITEGHRAGANRIYGRYTHIAEGLIRAAWCIKDKRFNIWFDSS